MNCQLKFGFARYFFRFVFLVTLLCGLLNFRSNQISQAQSTALGAWTNAGNLVTGRYSHSATLLANGKILIAGGYPIIPTSSGSFPSPLNSAEIFDPATGQSTPTGNMKAAIAGHQGILLPNGNVLVFSGQTAELYNPLTGIWTPTTPSTTKHVSFTITLLPNGTVLVVGESLCRTCSLTLPEVYDPVTQTWKTTGAMVINQHTNHSATLLANGKVLIAGGAPLANKAEIYDPATNSWSATGDLNLGIANHTAVRLLNGKVLVFGGGGKNAEVYDPTTGTWAITGSLNYSRFGSTSSLLNDGKVLISGGRSTSIPDSTCELIDPNGWAWYFTGDMTRPRISHALVALADGRVLAFGGRSDTVALKSVEAFNPTLPSPAGFWLPGITGTDRYAHAATLLPDGNVMLSGGANRNGKLNSAYILMLNSSIQFWDNVVFTDSRQDHTATLFPNGEVLIVGGAGTSQASLASCELYNATKTPKWRQVTAVLTPRRLHTATLLNNGKVLVTGGINDDVDVSSAEVFDPVTGLWAGGGFMSVSRQRHTATLLPDGKVLVVGGSRNGIALANAEIFDPANNRWTTAASLKTARYGHNALLLKNGKVLIAGGTGTNLVAGCELYDPATGQWHDAGQLIQPRQNHASALLKDGRAIVTGGSDADGTLNSVELFDPEASAGAGAWNQAASLKTARELHTILLMPDGRVFAFCGRNANGAVADSVEVFDPAGTPVIPISPSNITPVSASNFRGGNFAPESIVSIFGERLASKVESGPNFGGARVDVRDSAGQTRTAGLFYVSPTQINCLIPPLTSTGTATMTLTTSSGASVSTNINIAPVVPGVFSADASGTGLAAAVVLRVKANGEYVYEPMVQYDTALNRFVAVPIDVSNAQEQVFLILNGTGWRYRSRLSAVNVTVGGNSMETIYAGQQGSFLGLDQANVRLANSLAGRGEVEVQMTVDGIAANTVTVVIR